MYGYILKTDNKKYKNQNHVFVFYRTYQTICFVLLMQDAHLGQERQGVLEKYLRL